MAKFVLPVNVCFFLAGFHNVDGTLEIPPYPSSIPTDLFSYDLNSFDLGEIPDLSHGRGNSIMIFGRNAGRRSCVFGSLGARICL